MNMMLRTFALSALMLASLAGCGPVATPDTADTSNTEDTSRTEAAIETGSFKAVYSSKVRPEDWKASDAITADVDRKSESVVFTLADSSKKTLKIASRPKEKWQGDCATMGSSVLDEVADLSPAPLELGSLTFSAPVLYAKCGPVRLIVSEGTANGDTFIAFDRVKQ